MFAILETVDRTVAGVGQLDQVIGREGVLNAEVPVHRIGRLAGGIDPGGVAARVVGAGERNGAVGANDRDICNCDDGGPWLSWNRGRKSPFGVSMRP